MKIKNFIIQVGCITNQRSLYISYFVQVDQNTGNGVQETRKLVHIIIITVWFNQVHLLTSLYQLNVHQIHILRAHHFTRLHQYRGNSRIQLPSPKLYNPPKRHEFTNYTSTTHRSEKAVSSYSNGELFVRGVHCPDNRAKLLHEELQLAFMLLNIFSHQNGNLHDNQKSTQNTKIWYFNYIKGRTELL